MKALFSFCLFTLFMTKSFAASYEVPVAAALKEFATFELVDFKKDISDDLIVIQYKLPALLVGHEESIKLEGKFMAGSDELLLVGEKAVARCTSYVRFVCIVEYNDLNIDEAAAVDAINAISKTPEEKSARLEVRRAFSTDPVGIILY